MKTGFVVTLIASFTLGAPNYASSRSILSLEEAIDICTKRATKTATTSFGREGDRPPPHIVQDQYRSCVYVKSRQYPPTRFDTRKFGL